MDLLTLFELGDYQLVSDSTTIAAYVVLTDAAGWTLLFGDWSYSLYITPATAVTVRNLARNFDVFTCHEGDVDRMFGYQYFCKGCLVREYDVQSPRYSDRVVKVDTGKRLPGEDELLARDGYNIGIDVASLWGIPTRFREDDLRVYAPPQANQ